MFVDTNGTDALVYVPFHKTTDWIEWKREYERAQHTMTALGLIHGIFGVETSGLIQEAQRLEFLLRRADGWIELAHRGYEEAPLAEMAFETLANGFFKRPEAIAELRYLPHWALEGVFWFFRPRQEFYQFGRRGLHNFWLAPKRTAAADIAHEFCRRLMKSIWHERFFGLEPREYGAPDSKTDELARTLKPYILDIAAASSIGVFSLLRQGDDPQWQRVDDECLLRLQTYALFAEIQDDDDFSTRGRRYARSVEEAIAAGSPEAMLLYSCCAAQKVLAQQAEAREAEDIAAAAVRRAEDLKARLP